MDCFDNIPAELRVQILEACSSIKDMNAFLQASPAMDALVQSEKERLLVVRLKKLLPAELMQDALCISRFPPTSGLSRDEWLDQTEAHLQTWADGGFSNPTDANTKDVQECINVIHLIETINRFVDDYLSKANSTNLASAYRYIPDWAHPDFSMGFGQEDTAASLSSSCGSDTERYRCLKAFLRWEIYCRACGTVSGNFIVTDRPVRWFEDRRITWGSLWESLPEDKAPSIIEKHAILSAGFYIETIYDALLTQMVSVPPNGADWETQWVSSGVFEETTFLLALTGFYTLTRVLGSGLERLSTIYTALQPVAKSAPPILSLCENTILTHHQNSMPHLCILRSRAWSTRDMVEGGHQWGLEVDDDFRKASIEIHMLETIAVVMNERCYDTMVEQLAMIW
ncbi:hypothetical protein B0I35DRAFT_413644 [Stachybotrys elegans]|uniref:Uncharacterized protein n=1 Tax=Stachybotrys elegans TaxID=80388 RepID=A0A8K0SF19_9HYPO|nr:hypothetical protein B0I35DRAFT_413644 [Stachybotrys elegans]